MVESPDNEAGGENPSVRPRLFPMLAAALIAIGGLALFSGEGASQNQDSPRNQELRFDLPAPEYDQAVADYIDRTKRICRAARQAKR